MECLTAVLFISFVQVPSDLQLSIGHSGQAGLGIVFSFAANDCYKTLFELGHLVVRSGSFRDRAKDSNRLTVERPFLCLVLLNPVHLSSI